MSDTPQGPGWWLASDGRYYPPQPADGGAQQPAEQQQPPQQEPPQPQPPQQPWQEPQPPQQPWQEQQPPASQPGTTGQWLPPAQPGQPGQPGQQPGQPTAPPPGGWGQQAPVPPPQQSSNSGCLKIGLIVLAVLFVFGIGAVGCLVFVGGEVAQNVSDELERAFGEADPSDYELTGPECGVDSVDDVRASGSITNTSGERQAFQITVRFLNPDGSLITSNSTFTNGLDDGQSTDWEIITFSDAPADFTCEVDEVSYSIFD